MTKFLILIAPLYKGLKNIGKESYAFQNCGDLRLIVTDGKVKKEYDSFENIVFYIKLTNC